MTSLERSWRQGRVEEMSEDSHWERRKLLGERVQRVDRSCGVECTKD